MDNGPAVMDNGPAATDRVLDEIAQIADALLVRDAELQPTLDAIVAAAARAMPGAVHAGLILLERGRLVPQATAGEPPRRLDLLQRELGDGPCIAAAATQAVISIPDMGRESRWPQFATTACELDVHSMLCMPMTAGGQRMGALSLYCDTPGGLGDPAARLTRMCALLCSWALGEALRADSCAVRSPAATSSGRRRGSSWSATASPLPRRSSICLRRPSPRTSRSATSPCI
jgi:putative methionine-R-sulfoxide reductase with GAF domain